MNSTEILNSSVAGDIYVNLDPHQGIDIDTRVVRKEKYHHSINFPLMTP